MKRELSQCGEATETLEGACKIQKFNPQESIMQDDDFIDSAAQRTTIANDDVMETTLNIQNDQQLITSDIVSENDVKALQYFVQLLLAKDKKKFIEGCVNLVMGYFNKYLNGKEEIIGANNDDVDDNIKTWHAEKVASGGFGTVIKLTKRKLSDEGDLQVEIVRAIKIVPKTTIGLSEAFNASRLNHPHVVKLYNIMLIRNICCIEMEYFPLGSLQQLITEKSTLTLSNVQIVQILYQCCEVLALMKYNDMVHSDIKPENIMIKKIDHDRIEVAVCDFGLSKQTETIANEITTVATGGTIKYCAPELLKFENGKYTFKSGKDFKPNFYSDIYALGKTIKELTIQFPNDFDSSYNLPTRNQYVLVIEILSQTLNQLMSDSIKDRKNAFYYFIFNSIHGNDTIWKLDETANRFAKVTYWHSNILRNESLRKDREIVLKAIKQNGNALKFADESLRKDREIVLQAIQQNSYAFKYADESLRKDGDFVLQTIQQNGKYADESLRNSLESSYVDELFRNDFVLQTIQQNGKYNSFAEESFREMRLQAVKTLLEYADESLRKDRDFLLQAARTHFYVIDHESKLRAEYDFYTELINDTL